MCVCVYARNRARLSSRVPCPVSNTLAPPFLAQDEPRRLFDLPELNILDMRPDLKDELGAKMVLRFESIGNVQMEGAPGTKCDVKMR